MKKKWIAVLLAMSMALGTTMPAMAAEIEENSGSSDEVRQESTVEEEIQDGDTEQIDIGTLESNETANVSERESVLEPEVSTKSEVTEADESYIEGDTFSEGVLTYRVLYGEKTCEVIDCDESYSGVVEIPQSVKGFTVVRIYNNAFSYTSVEEVKIPESIGWIGGFAFRGSKIKKIEFPETISAINLYMFADCTELEEVILPETMESIGVCAFQKCTKLRKIKIPEGVTELRGETFMGCSELTSIELPDSVTQILDKAFLGCSKLENVYYSGDEEAKAAIAIAEGNDVLASATWTCGAEVPEPVPDTVIQNGVIYQLINRNTYEVTGYDETCPESIEIPATLNNCPVTSIQAGAFKDCNQLASVTISDNIVKIEDDAFNGCTSLASIAFSSNRTSLGERAFYGCTNLKTICLPGGLKKIARQTFEMCENLESIELPEMLEVIDNNAFANCSNLREINFGSNTLEMESKEETYENDLSQASSAEEGVKENSLADTTAESSEANEAKQEETIPAQEIMPTEESTASEETFPVPAEIVDESILEARTEMLSAADSETPGKYDSYDQFLAYYYLTYSPLDYYMDTAELPYQTYVKNVDDDFKTKLQAWRLATLDGKSAVEYSTKEVEFYELLIFDILYQDIAEDQILKNAETGVKTLEAAVQKDIAGVVYDWTLDTELTADNASEIVDRLVKCGDLEFLGDCVDILKKGVEYTKTVEELIEKLYMLKQLNSCSEEIAAVLKDLYNNSTDKQMKEGCRQVALVATGMMTEAEILDVFAGQVALNEVVKYTMDKVWDGVLKSTSLGKMIAIGQATGKLVANVLFSTDEIVENWYSMEQVCKFEEILKARLKVYQNRFQNNPTCENAKLFNAAADMYLSTQSVGMEYAKKYVEAVNGSGALGFIYKNFTHKDEYNELIRQLDSIKRRLIRRLNSQTMKLRTSIRKI